MNSVKQRLRKILGIGLVGVFVLASLIPSFAQDDSMMEGVTCDSTLVILLYLAEADYGFTTELDQSTIERGQFTEAFQIMMDSMMGEDDMMGEDEMMDDDMGDDMMGEDEMMDDMTTLTPGHIEGEPEICTQLREELDTFFTDILLNDMMMEDDMGG